MIDSFLTGVGASMVTRNFVRGLEQLKKKSEKRPLLPKTFEMPITFDL